MSVATVRQAHTDDTYLDPDANVDGVLGHLGAGRAVVVTGPPGVGKSRLLVECLRRVDGAALVTIRQSCDVGAVIAMIGAAIGCVLPPAGSDADWAARVGTTLSRKRIVLGIDGLELAPADLDAVLASWLEAAGTRVLLASRRVPGLVRGRHDVAHVEVACLATTRTGAAWAPAAELLRLRAREHARVRLDEDDAAAVHALATALDGVPLSLELIAAKLGILTPAQALAHVDRASSGGSPVDGALAASLDATLRASYELLDASGRAGLHAASVFRGGFTLDALGAVLGDRDAAYGAVQTLRDQSLLRAERRGEEYRFDLVGSVRKLADQEARRDTRLHAGMCLRHASYYASALPSALHDDVDNLRAGFECSLLVGSEHAATLALALTDPALRTSYAAVCDVTTRALAAEPPSPVRGELLLRRATARRFVGDVRGAGVDLEAARALAEQTDDARIHAEALAGLGNVASVRSDWKTSRTFLERALCIHPSEGFRSFGMTMVANTYCNEDDHQVAEPMMREAVALADPASLAGGVSRLALGVLLVEKGELEEAFVRLTEAEATLREQPHWRGIAFTYLGRIRHESGHLADALELYQRARLLVELASVRRAEAVLDMQCGLLYLELGQLDAADERLRRAAVLMREVCPDHEGFVLAAQAVLGVLRGAVADRERLFQRAAAALHGYSRPIFAAAIAVLQGTPRSDLDPELAAASDVRLAERLARKMGNAATVATLLAGEGGSWFRVDGGVAVALARRKAIQGVFAALLRERVERPGALVPVRELIHAGWPGAPLVAGSGAERVYAAVATLRKLGLRGLLEQEGDGYRLSADARVIGHAE